jgi:hypothetical protein
VNVRVDEAREQRRITEIDRARTGWRLDARCRSDRNDAIAHHEYRAVLDLGRARTVDQMRGAKNERARRGKRGILRSERHCAQRDSQQRSSERAMMHQ